MHCAHAARTRALARHRFLARRRQAGKTGTRKQYRARTPRTGSANAHARAASLLTRARQHAYAYANAQTSGAPAETGRDMAAAWCAASRTIYPLRWRRASAAMTQRARIYSLIRQRDGIWC